MEIASSPAQRDMSVNGERRMAIPFVGATNEKKVNEFRRLRKGPSTWNSLIRLKIKVVRHDIITRTLPSFPRAVRHGDGTTGKNTPTR
jgi:hypothetical protein